MSRATSPRLSRIGFPASTQSASASSVARSVKRRTQCCSTACRSYEAIRRIGAAASTALPMAESMARASASATLVAISPVYLSVTARSRFGASGRFAR